MSESKSHRWEDLSALLDGRLSPSEKSTLDMHLQSCAVCQNDYQEMKALRAVMQGAPIVAPPESFYQGVMQKIESDKQGTGEAERQSSSSPFPRFPVSPFQWFSSWPAKTLATACVVMVTVLVSRHEWPRQTMKMDSQSESVRFEEKAAEKQKGIGIQFGTRFRAINTAPPEALPSSMESSLKKVASAQNDLVAQARSPAESAERALNEIVPEPARMDASIRSAPLDESRQVQAKEGLEKAFADRKSELDSSSVNGAVYLQARDINGPATQGSFSHSMPDRLARAPAAKPAAPKLISRGNAPLQEGAAAGGKDHSSDLWKGVHSGVQTSRTVVVRSASEWNSLWQEHVKGMVPAPAAPRVDFKRYSVVAVFSGPKPSAGYQVTITRIQFLPDAVVVDYEDTAPSPGMASAAVVTHPHEFRLIPRTELPVRFQKQPS